MCVAGEQIHVDSRQEEDLIPACAKRFHPVRVSGCRELLPWKYILLTAHMEKR